ncbi:MAG: pyridoxal phosphate-dependent aminotransferase [Deltaproteobacteria bacterium]|nr:pyridoxal phosphate-dependent aminotransferase [Deltaproteobacteria bacterium]
MKLSERSQKIKPSPTLAIDAKAKEMKARGIDVINFGAGEPDFDTPDHIKEAAIKALKEGKTKYTAVGGIPELKTAIVQKLKRDNGLAYSPDEVIVSVGGKHALYNAFQALLDPGDEVIIPSPYWVSYPDQVLLCDGTPVILETKEKDGFLVRPEELEKKITRKTKIFVLNTPSNPTGAAYPRKRLEEIAEILVNRNIYCLSDEIYEKIIYDNFPFTSIASLNEKMKSLTITVNGASKVYSMTGWRMGYAVGPKEIIQAMTKIQGQVTTNINSATQWACVTALNDSQNFLKEWVAEFQKRRDFMVKELNCIPGIRCFKPQGAFYVFPNISSFRKTSEELSRYLLEEAHVAVVAGSGFGAEGFIRLSYATSMKNIEEGLKRTKAALQKLT